jgi:hypothetical protein
MQWEARDYSERQGAFKQEPSILSAAIEDAMKGAVPLAFAIQQSAECPLRVICVAQGRRRPPAHVRTSSKAAEDRREGGKSLHACLGLDRGDFNPRRLSG